MFYKQELGIDLGTDTIKIYDKRQDTVFTEKNMVALRNKHQVVAIGNEAYKIYYRSAMDTEVFAPIASGKIQDILYTEALIHSILYEKKCYIGRHPSLYFTVPCDMTEIEKRAYSSIAKRGRLKGCNVFLVENPIASAFALDIPITDSNGSMIVDGGMDGTNLFVICDSRVILNSHVNMGGDTFNQEIAGSIRRKNRLNISTKEADRIKKFFYDPDNAAVKCMEAMGQDIQTGLPRNGFVTRKTVESAVNSVITLIGEEISEFITRIPPQILKTISQEGVYLSGGNQHITDMDKHLEEIIKFPVRGSKHMENTPISGLREIILGGRDTKGFCTPIKSSRG